MIQRIRLALFVHCSHEMLNYGWQFKRKLWDGISQDLLKDLFLALCRIY